MNAKRNKNLRPSREFDSGSLPAHPEHQELHITEEKRRRLAWHNLGMWFLLSHHLQSAQCSPFTCLSSLAASDSDRIVIIIVPWALAFYEHRIGTSIAPTWGWTSDDWLRLDSILIFHLLIARTSGQSPECQTDLESTYLPYNNVMTGTTDSRFRVLSLSWRCL